MVLSNQETPNKKPTETAEKIADKFYLMENSGPITRRKDNQIYSQSNMSVSNSSGGDINSLKNFDEYYKDSKNVENEIYHYHPPRVSMSYQVDLTLLDKILNRHPGFEKIYELDRISKDELNYYLQFVSYYRNDLEANCLLKGVADFELNALDLLKKCNYDINLSLRKILFPCLDICGAAEANTPGFDPLVYVNSALNDLIGSNIHEKQQWLEYVRGRVEEGIDILELQELIELANKMKIEIPDFILEEIEKTLNFSKLVRRHLNEKNSLTDIYGLLEESKKFKVRTEEYSTLAEVIEKAHAWVTKVNELADSAINYKVLQSLYQEGKYLPVELEQFNHIDKRYHKAYTWQEKYKALPKHSKTRQNNSKEERCSLSHLAVLLKEADDINFTSHEVASLKTNYCKLREAECRIMLALEDPLKLKNKETLKDYIHILDSLKFTTDLYEYIINSIEYYDWKEKKDYYFNTKVLKIKHLRNLIKNATQKGLLNMLEIKQFKEECEKVENWLENITQIFYKETDSPESKIDVKEIYSLYNIGKGFEIKPEEVEHLLEKCEEIFDFINECKAANGSETYDFEKLYSLREQIQKYNIDCEEFEMINSQITAVHDWKELYDNIVQKKRETEKINFEFQDLISLEIRNSVIDSLEQFLRRNQTFMENLAEILSKVPQFAINSKEYLDLYNEYIQAESLMSMNNPEAMELDQLQVYINEVKNYFIKKAYFAQLLCNYRVKSWSYIATLKKKKTLEEAEIMLKEANNLKLDDKEVENLRNDISYTKEWLRKSKRYLGGERVTYPDFKAFIIHGGQLPLHSKELEEFWHFNAALENDIFQAKNILQNRVSYNELDEFMYKLKGLSVIVPEFELLENLLMLCQHWKSIADIIISSRKLCTLFFQNTRGLGSLSAIPLHANSTNNSTNTLNNNNIYQLVDVDEGVDKSSISEELGSSAKKYDNIVVKNNLEGTTNINIINNNFYFNNNQFISKKKLKKASKKEYENVLNIINNIPTKKESAIEISPKKKTSELSKSNLKKFHSFTYEEKLDIIGKTVVLKPENESEQYCICRRGDDSVNYMIMCENCKEWFHGKCLKISKSTAEKISQYICLACIRRKDLTPMSYHYEFFNNKRIGFQKFIEFIREGEEIPVIFGEMDSLYQFRERVDAWKLKYEATLTGKLVYNFRHNTIHG
jgi:hypothetical protein